MNLGTAGAILSHAIDLEEKAIEFYQKAVHRESNTDIKGAYEENLQRHRKIAKTLNRMRKETVIEMILEPVHGFNSDDFIVETKDLYDALAGSKRIELTILGFLRTSEEKVEFLPQMKGLLANFVERIMKNIDTLNNY